jgi:hypothetical protein
MKDMQFNLNEIVKVKLTDVGKKIFYELDKNFNWKISEIVDTSIYSNRIDNDGYVDMQMWEVMHLFGNHMKLGMDLPIEMNVILKSHNIKED